MKQTMKRIFLVISFVLIAGLLNGSKAQCSGCTYTYNGSGGTNFALNTGQKLCITGNAGSLSINVNGNSSICVASGVTWNVAGSISANQPLTIDVYGTLTATGNSSNANIIINVMSGATFNYGGSELGNGGVTLNNQGTVNFTTTGQLTIQGNTGAAKTINNLAGGVVNATSPSSVLFQTQNSILVNTGTFNVKHLENAEGNITNNTGSSVNISGNFSNHGEFKNYGAVIGTGSACGGTCLFTVGDKNAGFGFKNYSAGTVSFVGNATFQGYMVNEGAISINGNLTITWNGNNMAGGGNLLVNNGVSTLQNSGACFASMINFCDRNTAGHGFDVKNNPSCNNYTTANCSTLLPVRLISFDILNSAVDTRIRWTIETDEDYNKFELQSGIDGINFTTVETIVDNRKGLVTYLSKPVSPEIKTFYRLIIYYKDGSRDYSKVLVLNNNNTDGISIFPNPVRNNFFTLSVKNTAGTILNVFTAEGRLLLSKKMNGQTNYQVELPVSAKGSLVAEVLHNGIYKRIKLQSL